MDIRTAKKALDFFIKKESDEQQIFIYGGEPLLFPDLLKKTISHAVKVAKKRKQKITIWVGTNGVLLTRKLLEFFGKKGVGLAISLGGDKQSHDKYRTFENGAGSFERTLRNLKIMLKEFPRQQYSIGFCMHPSQVNKFHNNFLHLCSLGFEFFHSELIYDDKGPWTDDQMKIAQKQHAKIWNFIEKSIERNKMIYYAKYLDFSDTSINNIVKKNTGKCFFKNIEVMPEGDLYLSAFLASSRKNAVGSVGEGLKKNMFACSLNFAKIYQQDCAQCKAFHFKQLKNISMNTGVLEEMFRETSKVYLKKIDSMGRKGEKYLKHLQNTPYK